MIDYVEQFCTTGGPKDWALLLKMISGRGEPNVFKFGSLLKNLLEVEDKGIKKLIKEFRKFMVDDLVPEFITDYLLSFKSLYTQEVANIREEYTGAWKSLLEPFIILTNEEK